MQTEVTSISRDADLSVLWTKVAHAYHQVKSPYLPIAEDIAIMERFAAGSVVCDSRVKELQALLLGVTPSIALMDWPTRTKLLAVDNDEGMIKLIWPGDKQGVREAKQGNWLNLPVEERTCDFVIGDGSLNCFGFPEDHDRLLESVSRVLTDDGVLILRVFVQPEKPQSIDQLFDELMAGRFHTFDAFKYLLCNALVDKQFNVALQDVWRQWCLADIDEQAISKRNGWPSTGFNTIAYYENTNVRLSFPTLSAAKRVFNQRYEILDVATGSYPLAECCPIFLLRKNRG